MLIAKCSQHPNNIHYLSFMKRPVFITGIGTDIGKTVMSAMVTEALEADYWKPVQAGFAMGTDAEKVRALISNTKTVIYPEAYCLAMPASPHIAARAENTRITVASLSDNAKEVFAQTGNRILVAEGAGGLLVPLNEKETIADLILAMRARVILVSRNYLGSINHSRLTAAYCKQAGIEVAGWLFNDQYLNYENEIVEWSGYPSLGSVPFLENINAATIQHHANRLRNSLTKYLLD